MNKKFYITTPIYYVNALPHLGHAYTTFAADILARYHRLRGADVFFLTGTDDHAQKNVEAASKAGKSTSDYVAAMSARWQELFNSLGLTHDDFIRTTETRHIAGVQKFVKAVWERGDIYKGTYEGYYCNGCEAFVGADDLIDGRCPIHKTEAKKLKEENYFFKLSAYRQKLLKHIEQHPDFVQPESRRNEIIRYITDVMTDISITRPSRGWGIPFPPDETQTIYVWFDALVNYLTGVGYGSDEKKFKKWWPADVHLVGKDIIKFHGALWPAMLLSAGLPLPERIFVHGFWNLAGEKISKSKGNVVDPLALGNKYGLDAVRYFLFREAPFGGDGDWSEERLRERYNSDLANGLGNLVARVLTMAEKYSEGYPPAVKNLRATQDGVLERYEQSLQALDFSGALGVIWNFIHELDELIEREKPWILARTDRPRLERVLYELLESLRLIAVLLWPFLPQTSEKILASLGVLSQSKKTSYTDLTSWGWLRPDTAVTKGPNLFPKL